VATFALIHGGLHGSWCWERLKPALRERGHASITMDLPCDDPGAGVAEYVEVVARASAAAVEPPILVGHSMAGLILPHVAARIAVKALIYLCSMVAPSTPEQHEANLALSSEELIASRRLDDLERSYYDPTAAKSLFFSDLDPELQDWAVARLRPQATQAWRTPPYVETLPSVPAFAFVAEEDRLVRSTEAHRRMLRGRLRIEPITLPGGHSPFLARPDLLADQLDRIARWLEA
jgi:pimeloyl-ACP methyl ester carboxylesterase